MTEIPSVQLQERTSSEIIAYRRLWQSVLLRAFQDAFDKPGLDQHKARSWLTGYSTHFREVCNLAGLDAYYVFQRAKALEKEGWPNKRKDAGLKAA